MFRRSALLMMTMVLLAAPAHAQEWARKMFSDTSHEFGVVPRAGKAEYDFTFKNLYRDDIHISGVRASCGCTTPIVVTRTVKSGETGIIRARFNTRSFLGKRKATITVSIDRPLRAEVQLTVRGFVRQDVVLDPGIIDFGQVQTSAQPEKTVRVAYAGSNNWQISEVRSSNPHINTKVKEVRRSGGRVDYELAVSLVDEMPPGYLNDEVVLFTNDQLKTVKLMVQGRVVAPLTISPNSLFLGVLEPGQKVTKRIVVRSDSPFRVTATDCSIPGLSVKFTDEEKTLHLLPVEFTAGETAGEIQDTLTIHTSLPGTAKTVCSVGATIKAAE